MREISAQECFKLLKQHPIFSLWPVDLLNQFVKQLEIIFFRPGEVIVTEGEIINDVFFIISGKAEISKHETRDPTKQFVLATLHTSESIGLTDTGLFSTTGVRTATVVAITSSILLKIDLKVLHQFLLQHPDLNIALESSTQEILKLHLIKQSAPFYELSIDKIKLLAEKIDVKDVPENTLLFKQGDKGDYCYIIQEGQVEIIQQDENEAPEVVAVLSTSAVFGETAVIMDLPRTATAHTVTQTRLLRLLRDDLLTFLAKENKSKQVFANMIFERSRPKYLPNITAHQQVSEDNEFTVILKNPDKHEYYQLTKEGWSIWQYINGKRSVKEITILLMREHHIFSPMMVFSLILDLFQNNFIELQGYRLSQPEKLSFWMNIVDYVKQILEFEWSFPYVDQWVSKVYQSKVKIFYTFSMQMIMLLIIIMGAIFFALFSHKAILLLPHTSHLILLFVLVDIAGLISITLHELAHAFTTKHFGREVPYFGVGWYWIGPIAFTDTSDMWLSSKRPRIMVNIAGVYCDLILTGIISIIACIVPWTNIAVFLWLFCIFNYLSVYRNLFPLIELDGYYILMDLFDRPHLREDAVTWLVEVLPKIFKQAVFTETYKYEILYWLIGMVFIILSPIIAWFIQHNILIYIFPGLGHEYWQWLLPAIVITLSLLSVWVEIKKQRRNLN